MDIKKYKCIRKKGLYSSKKIVTLQTYIFSQVCGSRSETLREKLVNSALHQMNLSLRFGDNHKIVIKLSL